MAGGMSHMPLTSTEIWTVGSENDFEKGPDLPNWNFIGASMAQALDKKSLVISGGFFPGNPQKHIYEMKCSEKCEWKKLAAELKEPMRRHASMFIPAGSFNCGKTAPAPAPAASADKKANGDDKTNKSTTTTTKKPSQKPSQKEAGKEQKPSGNKASSSSCSDVNNMIKQFESR